MLVIAMMLVGVPNHSTLNGKTIAYLLIQVLFETCTNLSSFLQNSDKHTASRRIVSSPDETQKSFADF